MYKIGIDLGGTNIAAGVVNNSYRIVGTANYKTCLPRSSEEIIVDMANASRDAVAAAGLTMEDITSIGVSTPGTCNVNTGVVEYANNMRFVNVPLRDMLSKLLNKKVIIENDGNAAAWGEVVAGSGKGAKSCICVTLGTGIGSGFVLDGKIYNGFNYAATELGHLVIIKDGKECTCGRKGCWETYASATALISQTRHAMKIHKDSAMWKLVSSLDKVDGRIAFDAMRIGDSIAKQVVDTYIGYIACGLVNVINIFQPEVLCIGGGICKEGNTLLKPLKAYIERERYSKYCKYQTRLCTAVLGNAAGIIGAACL